MAVFASSADTLLAVTGTRTDAQKHFKILLVDDDWD